MVLALNQFHAPQGQETIRVLEEVRHARLRLAQGSPLPETRPRQSISPQSADGRPAIQGARVRGDRLHGGDRGRRGDGEDRARQGSLRYLGPGL